MHQSAKNKHDVRRSLLSAGIAAAVADAWESKNRTELIGIVMQYNQFLGLLKAMRHGQVSKTRHYCTTTNSCVSLSVVY